MKMTLENERIAKLETRAESHKEDLSEIKFDIKELHSRITTNQREVLDRIEDLDRSMSQKMSQNSDRSTQQHDDLKEEINEHVDLLSRRIAILEKWKWYIAGAALTIGWLLSMAAPIASLLK